MIRFRHVFRAALCIAAVAALGLLPGQAAKDIWSLPGMKTPAMEVLVFEADNCGYCDVFRRDIAPGYSLAPLATTAPLRFIDIGKVDTDRIGLRARLDVLPTVVLMKDGHEVDRITGLTAPSTFYVLMKHMIAKNAEIAKNGE